MRLPELNRGLRGTGDLDTQVIIDLSLIRDIESDFESLDDAINIFGAGPAQDGIIHIDQENGLAFVENALIH